MGRDREGICDHVHSEFKAERSPPEDEVRRRGEGQPVVQETAQACEDPDREADQTPAQPLGKILKETRRLERENTQTDSLLTVRQKSDLKIITRMYRQQKNHFENNDPRESVRDRIVSVSKPYVRPIVRGKEMKGVEFGAKCNNILVDGLSFIEKLSFNAFSEGTRLPHCLKMHRKLFGVDARKVGGDAGYSGCANREYCKERGIHTSFVKRGRPSLEKKKENDIIRNELARVRATRMEGSFGTQKEHYGLKRIKARTRLTEILYIFFGIHTANVVQPVRREASEKVQTA